MRARFPVSAVAGTYTSGRWGTCREDADMGGELGALDCGLVKLNKPLGLPREVQEAGGTRCPMSMGGVSAEVILFAVINLRVVADALISYPQSGSLLK